MTAERWTRRKRFLTLLLAAVLTAAGIVGGSHVAFAGTGMASSVEKASDSNGTEKSMTGRVKISSEGNAALSATAGDAAIMATGSNAGEGEFYCEEAGEISVCVFLFGAETLPEGAKLRVEAVDKEGESFTELLRQMKEKWAGEASELTAYNIGFYDENGEELETEGEAFVVVQFLDKPLNASDGLAIIHFKGTGPEELRVGNVEMDANKMVTGLSFQTDSFSNFGFLEHYAVPITGGAGTSLYTIVGVLILFGAVLLYRNPCKTRE